MIRIVVSESELVERIRDRHARWLKDAERTREHHRQVGRFERSTPKWSKIKAVYVKLQHGKCAYCERQLTIEEQGKAEWDVEHYRPKSSVSAWPTESIRKNRNLTYDLPYSTAGTRGYFLLAHHPLNYVAACKPCNSALKGNYFPVGAQRLLDLDDPRTMVDEKPYLIYPLGDIDEDPEKLMTFHGISPRAVAKDGHSHKRLRAVVTVDFFDLAQRDTLNLQRAAQINHLWLALEMSAAAPREEDRILARRQVRELTSPRKPHSNCARAFQRLYEKAPATAREIYEYAVAIFARDVGVEGEPS